MKRFSKEQSAKVSQHVETLRAAADKVTAEVSNYNSARATAWKPLEEAVAAYNAAVIDANAMMEGIAADQQSYIDERSEKWQEGDAGQVYQEWMQAWEGSLEELDIDEPDELEEPDMNAADALEELPDEPS